MRRRKNNQDRQLIRGNRLNINLNNLNMSWNIMTNRAIRVRRKFINRIRVLKINDDLVMKLYYIYDSIMMGLQCIGQFQIDSIFILYIHFDIE